MALSENLDVFMADFGVAVTDGVTATVGNLDMPSEVLAGGMIITTDYTLTIRANVYPALKYADSLTVAGASYTVREVRLLDDGVFATVYLSKT